MPGAYEPLKGQKECPTPHETAFDDCDTFFIWTSTQVVWKCCNAQRYKSAFAASRVGYEDNTSGPLELGPYKEGVTIVQSHMQLDALRAAHMLLVMPKHALHTLCASHPSLVSLLFMPSPISLSVTNMYNDLQTNTTQTREFLYSDLPIVSMSANLGPCTISSGSCMWWSEL